MSSRGPREPSQRQLRVGEQLKHIIAETMQRGDFHHDALVDSGHISVTEVRPSPDLRNATAYVISLGGANMDKIIPALNDSYRIFQKEISRQSTMKFTPRVKFKEDYAFEEGQKIENLLRDISNARGDDVDGE